MIETFTDLSNMNPEICEIADTQRSENVPEFTKQLNPYTDNLSNADQAIFNRTDFSQNREQSLDLKNYLQEHNFYSEKINDWIRSAEELEIYKEAGLRECQIGEKQALTRDIDFDYIDPDTGLSNAERMASGKSPIDSISGETIELHHIGQKMNSPLAELTETEHTSNYTSLHKNNIEGEIDRNRFGIERSNYWKERASNQEN